MTTPLPAAYEFPHYLAAKRTVDDRALNRPVWDMLATLLAQDPKAGAAPLRVLEIAAGIGTMIERTLAWGLFDGMAAAGGSSGAGSLSHPVSTRGREDAHRGVQYTAIDTLAENIAAAGVRLQDLPPWFDLRLETADVFDYCNRPAAQGSCDLLIAHAFLDLLDIPAALPRLRTLLRPGGIFYFTINFDGATILQPQVDPAFDAAIEAAYHRTMDQRITAGQPSGDSRTGRHLFGNLANAGFHVLAAGSSDWVVFPVNGQYPADEAYFLHFIVHTMHGALRSDPLVRGDAFERWIAQRHAQIERGELTYIAHQLDFVGRV
jgi:SAM-dependent methyltransferase